MLLLHPALNTTRNPNRTPNRAALPASYHSDTNISSSFSLASFQRAILAHLGGYQHTLIAVGLDPGRSPNSPRQPRTRPPTTLLTTIKAMEVSELLSTPTNPMAKKQPGKSIAFELLLDEHSKTRARIPLRVLVNAHDTTESIITTVKNFYGIYDGHGVCFEDSAGNTLIASHENLSHNATVYVRTVPGSHGSTPYGHVAHAAAAATATDPQRRPSLGEPFQMLPPHMREQSHSPSRSSSRLARKRSLSPSGTRGRRSASQQKHDSFSAMSRGSSASGNYSDDNGYSDSEAGRSSVSGSRRAKSDMLASSEISTANVLQDGRRGQTIFDSSVRTPIPGLSRS